MTTSRFPSWILRGAAFLLVVLLTPDQVFADVLLGVDGAGQTNSTLYNIDPTTGLATSIGAVHLYVNRTDDGAVSISALAYDPQNGLLYASTNTSNNPNVSTPSLVTLTLPANGQGLVQATLVGQPFAVGQFSMTALAFNPSGTTLYGYDKTAEALYSVSLATGVATAVDPGQSSSIGTTSGDGMAISAAGANSGTIYFAGKGVGGPLYTLSPTTGKATAGPTLTAPTPPPDLSTRQIKGLAFNSSDSLYGIALAAGSTAPIPADLVTINPTTGNITEVGPTQNGILALAFEPSPASVPEPGPFILLALPAVGWLLWFVVRCRRRSAAVTL